MDKRTVAEQLQLAANLAVERAASKLRGQWTTRDNGRCLHRSYDDLARAVGLGTDPKTLAALKQWVLKQRLPEPARLR
jgi:hypothetical protein